MTDAPFFFDEGASFVASDSSRTFAQTTADTLEQARRMFMEADSFQEFLLAHSLGPFVRPKRACQIANVGPTKLYELIADGQLEMVKDGRITNITARSLYARYRRLIEARSTSQPCIKPGAAPMM
jgi:hypothetical protein